jgi:hypothetical protein
VRNPNKPPRMISKEKASYAINLAEKHAAGFSEKTSVRKRLADAKMFMELSRFSDAWEFSRNSLAFSIGPWHDDYKALLEDGDGQKPE